MDRGVEELGVEDTKYVPKPGPGFILVLSISQT